jgi:flagellar biosynthesis/type III secretory pathway protein FliH
MSLDEPFRRALDDLGGQLREQIARAIEAASAELKATADAERKNALEAAEVEFSRRLHSARAEIQAEADAERTRALDAAAADAARRLHLAVESAEVHAREIGYNEGREVGRREGREIGVAEGTAQGLTAGRDEGRAAGFDAGRQQGWDEGWRRGFSEGQKSGYDEGQQVVRGEQRFKEQQLAHALADAMRTLDRAPSLSAILDVLVNACGLEAPRVAVLLTGADRFRAWRLRGFGAPFDRSVEFEVALVDAGLLVDVVRTQAGASVRSGGTVPSFAGDTPHADAFATPVVLGGQVVAVVYADCASEPPAEGADEPAWWARIEAITRHAARCLETVTALRTAQLFTARVAGGGASGRWAAS